jgi:hypothetical protein
VQILAKAAAAKFVPDEVCLLIAETHSVQGSSEVTHSGAGRALPNCIVVETGLAEAVCFVVAPLHFEKDVTVAGNTVGGSASSCSCQTVAGRAGSLDISSGYSREEFVLAFTGGEGRHPGHACTTEAGLAIFGAGLSAWDGGAVNAGLRAILVEEVGCTDAGLGGGIPFEFEGIVAKALLVFVGGGVGDSSEHSSAGGADAESVEIGAVLTDAGPQGVAPAVALLAGTSPVSGRSHCSHVLHFCAARALIAFAQVG